MMGTKTGNQNGMNWVTPQKRLAIYCRDGFACLYCGAGVENCQARGFGPNDPREACQVTSVQLTLDHLTPRVRGGGNREDNLITCCMACNTARGKRPWRLFATESATGRNEDPKALINYIQNCVRRRLRTDEARQIMEHRPRFREALRVWFVRENPPNAAKTS